jgi:phosphosulfolactate phosphohydrolase-like enzyme
MHSNTIKNWLKFRVIGLSSPQAATNKAFLFKPTRLGEIIVIILLDVIRCSTTLSIALAKGCGAVVVTQKQSGIGCTRHMAEAVRAKLHLSSVIEGGELDGKPIPGAVLSNSPLDASANDNLSGTLLRFSSTNFGSQFFTVMPLAESLVEQGADVTVLMANAFNSEAIAQTIGTADRVFLCAGGFYNAPSMEDLTVAGQIICRADINISELDDEARSMLACFNLAEKHKNDGSFYHTTAIGRCLSEFGRAEDINASMVGTGLCPFVQRRLTNLLPTVDFIETAAGKIPTILAKYLRSDNTPPNKNVIFAVSSITETAVKFDRAA